MQDEELILHPVSHLRKATVSKAHISHPTIKTAYAFNKKNPALPGSHLYLLL